jgi:hypothetical protein
MARGASLLHLSRRECQVTDISHRRGQVPAAEVAAEPRRPWLHHTVTLRFEHKADPIEVQRFIAKETGNAPGTGLPQEVARGPTGRGRLGTLRLRSGRALPYPRPVTCAS